MWTAVLFQLLSTAGNCLVFTHLPKEHFTKRGKPRTLPPPPSGTRNTRFLALFLFFFNCSIKFYRWKVIASSNHLGNNDMLNLTTKKTLSAKMRVKSNIFAPWEEDINHEVRPAVFSGGRGAMAALHFTSLRFWCSAFGMGTSVLDVEAHSSRLIGSMGLERTTGSAIHRGTKGS